MPTDRIYTKGKLKTEIEAHRLRWAGGERGAEGAANEQSEENKEHTEAKGSLIRSDAHIAKAVDKANKYLESSKSMIIWLLNVNI